MQPLQQSQTLWTPHTPSQPTPQAQLSQLHHAEPLRTKTDSDEEMDCYGVSEPIVGDTVLVQGLVEASHLNDKFAVITGFDSRNDRYILMFSPTEATVRVKKCNVMFPARCPCCESEVTSSGCFDCGYGIVDRTVDCSLDQPAADSGDSKWNELPVNPPLHVATPTHLSNERKPSGFVEAATCAANVNELSLAHVQLSVPPAST